MGNGPSNQCEGCTGLAKPGSTWWLLRDGRLLHLGQNIVEGRDPIDHALRQGSIRSQHPAFIHSLALPSMIEHE
jgi:hypothetical protein